MNNHARTQFCTLSKLFSSPYQQASFRVLVLADSGFGSVEFLRKAALARFAQITKLGVNRFLMLSLLAFVLSQWAVWSTSTGSWPDWRAAATLVRRVLLSEVVLAELLVEFERLRPYLETAGVPSR